MVSGQRIELLQIDLVSIKKIQDYHGKLGAGKSFLIHQSLGTLQIKRLNSKIS